MCSGTYWENSHPRKLTKLLCEEFLLGFCFIGVMDWTIAHLELSLYPLSSSPLRSGWYPLAQCSYLSLTWLVFLVWLASMPSPRISVNNLGVPMSHLVSISYQIWLEGPYHWVRRTLLKFGKFQGFRGSLPWAWIEARPLWHIWTIFLTFYFHFISLNRILLHGHYLHGKLGNIFKKMRALLLSSTHWNLGLLVKKKEQILSRPLRFSATASAS